MEVTIDALDNLFISYNYQVNKQSNSRLRIYTLRYGMYHAAELIKLDPDIDVTRIKTDFSESGYATEVQNLTRLEHIEEYLFEGFFIKTPLGNELKRRYTQFVHRQLVNLPDGSDYKYIDSDFEVLHQGKSGEVLEKRTYTSESGASIIEKINNLISTVEGSIFIIIEAAAGFGKTCTANEILNTFSTQESKKLPFFTELSRNREARVFKHILLNEIDEQFPTGIKQNIVIDQISKGRIPLIIDGFDELISKESNKEEVESMLTTILELLKGEAKVIITSRKTAMFSSEEFLKSIDESKNVFSIARIEIKEPSLENWLHKDRIDLIKEFKFPLENLANPVLLSYLRNISIEKLKDYLNNGSEETLVDKYLDYLLKREQVRQNIKLANEAQLNIFRKLVRFMAEYDFTAESKAIIKDFIKEYNTPVLKASLNDYIAEEKPSLDDLVETLSNHVFLDRKSNGDIGFINDFIFGSLIGDNLISGKFQKHYPNYNSMLPIDFAVKCIQAYKIQKAERKNRLWEIFNSTEKRFDYDIKFFFDLDYFFLNKFTHNFTNLFITDYTFKGNQFIEPASFNQSGFSNCVFESCFFNIDIFSNCMFHNCTFYKCDFTASENDICFNDFAVFACYDDNGFLEKIAKFMDDVETEEQQSPVAITELSVLKQFFNIDGRTPKARKITHIKENLSDYSSREINIVISKLKNLEYLYFKDDVGFISKAGINYFNQIKNALP